MMLPQVRSLIQVMFVPSDRVAALGMFGILGGTAAVAGPLVGGALIAANPFDLGWRAIFLVNVPVGLALIALAGIALALALVAPLATRVRSDLKVFARR